MVLICTHYYQHIEFFQTNQCRNLSFTIYFLCLIYSCFRFIFGQQVKLVLSKHQFKARLFLIIDVCYKNYYLVKTMSVETFQYMAHISFHRHLGKLKKKGFRVHFSNVKIKIHSFITSIKWAFIIISYSANVQRLVSA